MGITPRLRLTRRACISIAIATVLALGASMPARAGSTTGSTDPTGPLPAFGAQFHATWTDYTNPEREIVLAQLEAAGVTWVRIDVGWETLEPRRGHFDDWYRGVLDHAVSAARRHGMSIILTVFATPSWANGGHDSKVPPKKAADYGAVVGELARRYAGKVAAYEVWNEPNIEQFFAGTPQRYTKLLKSAYTAVKDADPDAKVVGGATVYNDDAFLEAVYDAGGEGSFDVWSTHPYMGKSDSSPDTPDDGTPYTMDHVRVIRSVLDEHDDEDVSIWFTEFGWSNHSNGPNTPGWRHGVTKDEQADYLVRAVEFVGAAHPYVEVMIWYTERNTATGNRHEDNFGLLTHDLEPKPVYHAVKELLTA